MKLYEFGKVPVECPKCGVSRLGNEKPTFRSAPIAASPWWEEWLEHNCGLCGYTCKSKTKDAPKETLGAP